VLLWFMPGVVFPHPGANDALELAYLGPLLYLFILGASIVSVVGVVVLNWKAEGIVGLGVFFLGVAATFVSSIFTLATSPTIASRHSS
jgi:hypothetical protein